MRITATFLGKTSDSFFLRNAKYDLEVSISATDSSFCLLSCVCNPNKSTRIYGSVKDFVKNWKIEKAPVHTGGSLERSFIERYNEARVVYKAKQEIKDLRKKNKTAKPFADGGKTFFFVNEANRVDFTAYGVMMERRSIEALSQEADRLLKEAFGMFKPETFKGILSGNWDYEPKPRREFKHTFSGTIQLRPGFGKMVEEWLRNASPKPLIVFETKGFEDFADSLSYAKRSLDQLAKANEAARPSLPHCAKDWLDLVKQIEADPRGYIVARAPYAHTARYTLAYAKERALDEAVEDVEQITKRAVELQEENKRLAEEVVDFRVEDKKQSREFVKNVPGKFKTWIAFYKDIASWVEDKSSKGSYDQYGFFKYKGNLYNIFFIYQEIVRNAI